MTPSILLNRGKTCKISVSSDRYYPVEVELKSISDFNSRLSIFVKKKSGRLSYAQDPHGLRSFFSQIEEASGAALDFIRSFIEDRKLVAYANYMCNNDSECPRANCRSQVRTTLANTFEDFCVDVVQESLKEEKTEAIMTYLALYDAISTFEKKAQPSKTIWELRILRTFYRTSERFELVDPHFVALLCETVDKFFAKLGQNESILSELSLSDGGDPLLLDTNDGIDKKRWVGPISVWYNVP